ncbi:hypothetical protein M758_UG096800 [Ceratodon purpureus]|nr:hypothetical protein M758_UG096800 [Ceratodon purpureus]
MPLVVSKHIGVGAGGCRSRSTSKVVFVDVEAKCLRTRGLPLLRSSKSNLMLRSLWLTLLRSSKMCTTSGRR